MPSKKQSGETKWGSIAAVCGGLVVVVALVAQVLGNMKTIEEFFGGIFSLKNGGTATSAVGSTQAQKKVVKVCMGNGGGDNCLGGADAKYDCNTYNGMGGGAQKTYDTLAGMFCGYTENGVQKVARQNIVVIQDNGGGQCGWTAFQVTCNP